MRKKIVTLALAGSLGLGGAVLLAPGLASAQSATPSPSTGNAVTDRITALKDALKGLVSDRTLTQAQADRVASTLAERFPRRGPGGHHGPHGGRVSHEAVAEVLGITVAELEAAREQGKTLAQIAEDEGVARDKLISGLVAAAKEQLAADVQAGRLTQAQADELSADLTARVTEKIDRVGDGPGGHGRGHHHGDQDAEQDARQDDAPNTSPSPSTQASSTTA